MNPIQFLIPKPFQDFVDYVSPSGLAVIHKEKVISQAIQAAKNAIDRSQYEKEVQAIQQSLHLESYRNQIGTLDSLTFPKDLEEIDQLDEDQKKRCGEILLTLYFHLIFRSETLFLDLRPSHLRWSRAKQMLVWHPSRLWHKKSAEFSSKIQDLYLGFFGENEEATLAGIELYRWDVNPRPGYDERIKTLLKNHFGSALNEPIGFSISHFKSTFHQIFEEAKASGAKFHPELVFVGATLSGLYVSLEALNSKFLVKQSFQGPSKNGRN